MTARSHWLRRPALAPALARSPFAAVKSFAGVLAARARSLTPSISQHRARSMCLRCLPGITPSGRLAGLFGMVLIPAFALLGWHELLVFAVVVLSVLGTALILPTPCSSITAALSVDALHVVQGHDVGIQMILHTPVSVMLPSVMVLHIDGTPHHIPVPPLHAGQEHRIGLSLNAPPRSRIAIESLSIQQAGPFALTCHEQRLCTGPTVHIHPRTVSLPYSLTGRFQNLDGDDLPGIADDGISFQGLRPYVPGDDMRGVHWLSTAKTGVPMIRQYDRTRCSTTLLCFDSNASDYSDREEFELAVSVVASIGAHCLNRHDRLYVDAVSGRIGIQRVADLLDLCSGFTPQTNRTAQPCDTASPPQHGISMYCHVIGSRHDAHTLRSRIKGRYPQATRIVIVASADAEPSIAPHADKTILTVGSLDQLAQLWKAVIRYGRMA